MIRVRTTGDAAGVLVGAAVGSGVLATGTMGTFLIRNAGTTYVPIHLTPVAVDWLM